MLSNVSIYEKEYIPNKIYWDKKSGTSRVLMPLDDGSYVVGKGTAMPVAFSSDVGTADDEVEPIRARFLNSANRLKETLRFENFTDLQRFLRGRTENICEGVVLLDYPKKIYVGSNKWGEQFCVVNHDAEIIDGYISLNSLDSIYSKDLVKIPVIDHWVSFRMSLEEFNKMYREYDGEFTYSAEASTKKASAEDAVTTLSNIFLDVDLQRLLKVQERDIDELIQECRANLFKDLSWDILNGKVEPSQLTEEDFIEGYCKRDMMCNLNLQQLVMLYGIKKSFNRQGD